MSVWYKHAPSTGQVLKCGGQATCSMMIQQLLVQIALCINALATWVCADSQQLGTSHVLLWCPHWHGVVGSLLSTSQHCRPDNKESCTNRPQSIPPVPGRQSRYVGGLLFMLQHHLSMHKPSAASIILKRCCGLQIYRCCSKQ